MLVAIAIWVGAGSLGCDHLLTQGPRASTKPQWEDGGGCPDDRDVPTLSAFSCVERGDFQKPVVLFGETLNTGIV